MIRAWLDRGASRDDVLTVIGAVLAVLALCVACTLRGCAAHADGASSRTSDVSAAQQASLAADASSSAGQELPAQDAAWESYSWGELSDIAAEIAAAPSYEEGLQVAMRYQVLAADGTIDTAHTKRVDLPGGAYQVGIIGIRSDIKADGSGLSGITFAFTSCVDSRQMNDTSSNQGGWYGSQLREWLNETFFTQLPSDLSQVIVPVRKDSFYGMWPYEAINEGADVWQSVRENAQIASTDDKLFLLAHSEIAGPVEFSEYDDNLVALMGMIDEEGSQYQLFAEMGVVQGASNDGLVRTFGGQSSFWWLRTADPKTGVGFYDVSALGIPTYGGDSRTPYGIVPAFCL